MIPTAIIIHCSATKDSGTVSWAAIRRYHTQVRGWRDIGYHMGVELVTNSTGQSTYEAFLGRSWVRQGAHCRAEGMNGRSLGVCFVGDYDQVPPPTEMLAVGARHIAAMCRIFNILPVSIYGHRDFEFSKTCPGLMFNVDNLRWLVTEEM
jgi:N-acetylmuramoyl-L-alanine amidase